MNLSSRKSGFTLVELLVVIAVLGVLAAVVMVSINPLEQLARGRDSGRKTSVSQIGNAAQAYYTTHANIAGQGYPPILGVPGHGTDGPGGWLKELVWARELKQNPAAIGYTAAGSTPCNTNAQNFYCYTTNVTGEAVVFARMESQSETSKCTAAGQYAFFVWSSASGKAGIVCSPSDPTGLGVVPFIE